MGRRGQATLSADLLSRADQMSRKRPASAVTCRDGCTMADDLREWSFGSFTIVPFDGARSPRKVPEGSHCRRCLSALYGSTRSSAVSFATRVWNLVVERRALMMPCGMVLMVDANSSADGAGRSSRALGTSGLSREPGERRHRS